MEEQKKKSVRSDHWIQENIVVKVITKRLGEKYYKKKAVIRVSEALSLLLWSTQIQLYVSYSNTVCMCVISQEVQNKYTAMVRMIDSGDKLKLDQSHLETVIPAPGTALLLLNMLLLSLKVIFAQKIIYSPCYFFTPWTTNREFLKRLSI